MSQQFEPPATPPAEVFSDGALLLDIYRRLVPLHATLTEHGARQPDLPSLAAADLMAVLREIEASPSFRAAHDSEQERRRICPTPEARAARERGEAIVERFRRAREERSARAASAPRNSP